MASGRYAAIDIGTVTCRMLVADACDGRVVPVAKEYAITNLGEGVDATGRLKPEAMARVACVIDRYLGIRDTLDVPGHPVCATVVVATSAARDAGNADEFARMLAQRGLELMVIPGQREAALSFLGATSGFAGPAPADASPLVAVVDVGGGSTEIVVGRAGEAPQASRSFDVGCRRVTERFFAADPPSADDLETARAWMRHQFEPYFGQLRKEGIAPQRLIAVAGTATSVVSIRKHMEVYDSSQVHGSVVTRGELQQVAACLGACSAAQRARVVGLDPGRAPVIVAGLAILDEVMAAMPASSFVASEDDILQGMILEAAHL